MHGEPFSSLLLEKLDCQLWCSTSCSALLGKGLGGGIAFIDSITDTRWGFGISSGLEGKIRSLDGQALDDIFMVVHELGVLVNSFLRQLRHHCPCASLTCVEPQRSLVRKRAYL